MTNDELHRPSDDLGDQLDRIEATSTEALREARLARQESQATNGRLAQLERDHSKVEEELYGPEETRRRENQPGVIGELKRLKRQVSKVVGARDESAAVSKAMRWIIGIGLTMIGTMIAAVALLVQIVSGGGA